MTDLLLVRINCPDKALAVRLASSTVSSRLVACANIEGPIASVYEWDGQIEQAEEWVLWLKTTADRWDEIEAFVRTNHPHEVPAILAIPCCEAHAPFAKWVAEATDREG